MLPVVDYGRPWVFAVENPVVSGEVSPSYSLRRIVQLPTVPVRAALTIHEARRSSRHVLFAIIFAAGIDTAILIDIVLATSYLLSSLPPASSLPSSLTSYLSHITCYHQCCQHPHCHPHRHCTHRVVLYNLPLSVPLFAALTMSRSSSIFAPHLICYRTCRL